MSQWQPHIRNSRHHKDNLKDCERYKEHIRKLKRAREIIKSNEGDIIVELMLEEIGCDREIYGDVIEMPTGSRCVKVISYEKLDTSLKTEIRSFRHALRIINTD